MHLNIPSLTQPMQRANWVTTWETPWDIRHAVQYDGDQVTANDGDVCMSYITYDYLKKIPNPYCLDVGADLCWWSKFCCEHIPNTHVDAFEPKSMGTEFHAHLAQAYPNICLHEVAISDTEGQLPFLEQGSDSHSRAPTAQRVPCTTLPPFLDAVDRVDLIKIDTEGHELRILQSLLPYTGKIGAILFECSIFWYGDTHESAMSNTYGILKEYLKAYPFMYTLSRRGPPVLTPVDETNLFTILAFSYEEHIQYDIFMTKGPFAIETKFTGADFFENGMIQIA